MKNNIYQGDIGLEINVDCQEDLTSATSPKIYIQKPDGNIMEKIAIISGTFLRYVTVDGDLDQKGMYHVQPEVHLNGWFGSGVTTRFYAYPKFSGSL